MHFSGILSVGKNKTSTNLKNEQNFKYFTFIIFCLIGVFVASSFFSYTYAEKSTNNDITQNFINIKGMNDPYNKQNSLIKEHLNSISIKSLQEPPNINEIKKLVNIIGLNKRGCNQEALLVLVNYQELISKLLINNLDTNFNYSKFRSDTNNFVTTLGQSCE